MDTEQIVIHKVGGPSVLSVESAQLPRLEAGQVLLRHTAIGVNYIDTYHRSGLTLLGQLPHSLGVEAVGVVEQLGFGVDAVHVGQRVAYVSGPPGAYATYRHYPGDRLIPLPDDIDDETAAAGLLKGMTAEFLTRRTYAVSRDEFVLVHAAAGGVGTIICQWLAAIGARVIGTVGSEEKAKFAKGNGCEFPIVYTKEDFAERVLELTAGTGLNVVYDSVGKDTFNDSLRCLTPRGLMVSFGNASGKPEPFDIARLATSGSLYLTRPSLFDYTRSRSELLASAAEVFDVLRSGTVRVRIGRRYAFRNADDAHRDLEARTTMGSSILLP